MSSIPGLLLVIAAPYLAGGGLLGLLMAVICRRTVLAAVAVCVAVVSAWPQASWYFLGRQNTVGPNAEVRVLVSNLRLGRADPSSFVNLANNNADVITAAELTPEAAEGLKAAGIDRTFRYSLLQPDTGAGGNGIWSRYPLRSVSAANHPGAIMPTVLLRVPGVRFDPVLTSIHVMSPVAGDEDSLIGWQGEIAATKSRLNRLAITAGRGTVIAGGDYNSTPDMQQFRNLLEGGYRDSVEATGAGFAPTFPSDRWFPPLITIDHVLVRNGAPAAVQTVSIKGSDHRALLVTVKVPLEPR